MYTKLHYILKRLLPQSLKDKIKQVLKKRREAKLAIDKSSGNVFNEKILKEQLLDIGLQKNNSVLVHSSLSRLGYIEGGADTVLSALLSVIGKEGTLMLPTYPFNSDVKTYIETVPIFDVNNTTSKMGKITEVFRTMPGVERSLHPTHSVAALGPLAKEFIRDHFGQLTPFNQCSPFYKLSASKGKILLLGVNLDSLTNFHTLEDAVVDFPYPVYCDEEYEVVIIDNLRISRKIKTKVHNPEMSAKRQCNAFRELFLTEGVMRESKIGNSMCYLIDAFKLHECMLRNFKEKRITMYTPHGS